MLVYVFLFLFVIFFLVGCFWDSICDRFSIENDADSQIMLIGFFICISAFVCVVHLIFTIGE